MKKMYKYENDTMVQVKLVNFARKKKKKKKPCSMRHFCPNYRPSFQSSFLPILGKLHFLGPRERKLGPTKFF